MDEKTQVKNIHIVFFFKYLVEYNSLELANSIYKRIPSLGQPNILSLQDNIPNEVRMQVPKIIFNNNRINVSITLGKLELNIFSSVNDVSVEDEISKLFKSLDEQGIKVQSIGIVYDYLDFECTFSKIKELFCKDELAECDSANIAWFKRENELNVWKTINMVEKNSKECIKVIVDVNNKGNETNMTEEEILDLVEKSAEKSSAFMEELIRKIGG